MMHITDWLPTLCALVGVKPTNEKTLDGFDQSDVCQKAEVDLS